MKRLCAKNMDRLDINNIPDIMYFGSNKEIDTLKNEVFLTPFIGVASMFIVDIKDIKMLRHSDCNIGYEEWNYSDEKLKAPLKEVHINHNIKEITNVEKGISKGFIYKINISKVKDKLSLFVTNDPYRELIYNDSKALNIIEVISHEIEWTCSFSQENANCHGYGIKF